MDDRAEVADVPRVDLYDADVVHCDKNGILIEPANVEGARGNAGQWLVGQHANLSPKARQRQPENQDGEGGSLHYAAHIHGPAPHRSLGSQ
jgi:hypothetical protein